VSVFGEGAVNDGVVIILFNAVNAFFAEGSNASTGFSLADAGNLMIDFISLGIMSLLWGLFCGFACAYLLKRWVIFMKTAPEKKIENEDGTIRMVKSEE
jgi:NhaP-type Na+/H+ or K+/H+ antiporter